MVVAIRIQNEGPQLSALQDRMGLREMLPPQQVEGHILYLHRFNCREHCPTSKKGAQRHGLCNLSLRHLHLVHDVC